jgi:preprotein translocase subunit SecB
MSYKIIGKYIKKVEFSIPSSQMYFLLSKNIANYRINIDITSGQIKNKIIEVETALSLLPINKEEENIKTKIIFATIIEIPKNINDKNAIEQIILINVPSEIYPELRRIFILMFESSGFKNIQISENVDFKKLYKLKKN